MKTTVLLCDSPLFCNPSSKHIYVNLCFSFSRIHYDNPTTMKKFFLFVLIYAFTKNKYNLVIFRKLKRELRNVYGICWWLKFLKRYFMEFFCGYLSNYVGVFQKVLIKKFRRLFGSFVDFIMLHGESKGTIDKVMRSKNYWISTKSSTT